MHESIAVALDVYTVEYFAESHRGLVRPHNEDSYEAIPEKGLWIVADGMGGHAAGEVASRIVVEQVAQAYEVNRPIADAIMVAHRAVLEAPKHGIGKKGMGSTVVVLALRGDQYEIAWVGDSRAYRWDGVSLHQLTRDHTYLQGLIDRGEISLEEAVHNPLGSILEQAVGVEREQINVGSHNGELRMGDKFLLCSDGLSGEVSHEGIEGVFKSNLDARSTVEALIEASLAQGGADNVTAVVVSV